MLPRVFEDFGRRLAEESRGIPKNPLPEGVGGPVFLIFKRTVAHLSLFWPSKTSIKTGLFCILKKNEKRMKKMFDMPRGALYKADLCSAKRLEKQSETTR
jgi:hypothetical protein